MADKNLTEARTNKRLIDFLRILVKSIISLKRLSDGGAAIFAANIRNHHMDSCGIIAIIPLVINDLRVWVIEYEILARINRLEDTNPWAIIIIMAPLIPHDEFVITPAINNPM